jgi:hypothetical protein
MNLDLSWQIFEKYSNIKNSWNYFQWQASRSMRAEGRMDRRTDMTKLIVALRNFANVPKNDLPCLSKKDEPNVTHPEKSGFYMCAEF